MNHITEGYLVKVITRAGNLDVPWIQLPDKSIAPIFRDDKGEELVFKTQEAAEFAIKQEQRNINRFLTIIKVYKT